MVKGSGRTPGDRKNMTDRFDKKEKKRYWQFMGCMMAFAVFYYLRYFKHVMTEYNTTLFAMNYDYGFISRGMLGTIWSGLDRILPMNLMTYEAVYWFNWGITCLFSVLVIVFIGKCLAKIKREYRHNMYYMAIACGIYFFPMFWSEEMFGRLDVYLYCLTFVALFAILEEKAEWIILLIGILCMCIHQGFVFTNANLILVPLFYKILTSSGKRQKKYIFLFVSFLLTISALFLYFEFFSHGNGAAIYDDVVAAAKALSEDGKGYNKSILKHEILGEDVYASEARYRELNRAEFPAFLLLYAPYIPIVWHFFTGLFRRDVKVGMRWIHTAFLLGALTILPQYILKVDYGRYAFTTFTYYIVMLMMFMVLGDETAAGQLEDTKEKIKQEIPVPWIVLLYPMFLMPFYDVIISGASSKLRTLVQEVMEWI